MNEHLFLNSGYLLILFALTVRDILRLRGLFIVAHIAFVSYALVSNNRSMAVWNILFMAINVVHVVRILRDRKPIALPDGLKDIHKDIFSVMSPKEFFNFWQMGKVTKVNDEIVVYAGERLKQVFLILDGAVSVVQNGNVIARLSRGSFIGEMSFLTGDLASATVSAKGLVSYIAWEHEKLGNIREVNPSFFVMIQAAFGKDLIHKIKRPIDYSPDNY